MHLSNVSNIWYDIETAPKDGSPFLFCEYGKKPVYVGFYGHPKFNNVIAELCLVYCSYVPNADKNYFRLGNFIRCGLKPTHWTHLPIPPGIN